MTVDELEEKENKLLLQINSTEGPMEVKVGQLEAGGVFDEYRQVHSFYADLAQKDSEALKRGLFLQWYSSVEPSFLSGIDNVDPQAEKRIIDTLNNQIGRNEVDSELYSMLSYYAGWRFVFDRFSDSTNLVKLLNNRLDYDSIIQQLKQSDLTCRGQMGIYWQSIIPLG
ncbi:hypothetical protein GO755_40380 [Spirosoma sp. HMF4905]|uniref:Uncharacterized protein n=1 Tax=Spirosoma arboris TaxID=2682092 RepID=A0A7K1SRG2_9BACT|nr:hypothetical protein [Spirosoma arboris]MVM36330.1 hypothetical protein [Spirosoma arboris]